MALRPARKQRGPAGLQWRLTAWVAGVLLVAAAILAAVVLISTGRQITGQIDREVGTQSAQLAQAMSVTSPAEGQRLTARAEDYLRRQPYSGNSTLLFVIIPGGRVISNHPELFGFHGREPGETSVEQAEENREGQTLRRPRVGRFTSSIPDVGQVRLQERSVDAGSPPVIVGAGEPLALVHRAQRSVTRALALAGSLILLLALIASYLAGTVVSAPLRRMAAVARRVDGGELAPRMPPELARSSELRVLTEAFNHMLDRLQAAFDAQRSFVADASHELRTPLTVIRGQLELLSATGDPAPEEVARVQRLLQAELHRVERLVGDMLLLAQAEQRQLYVTAPIDLPPFVQELWDGLSLTAARRFEIGPVPAGSLLADADRLAQALRNLARNAIEHTSPGSGLVRLDVTAEPGGIVSFCVLDDGPGIAASERERVFQRFHRTDPHRSRRRVGGQDGSGAGLGLAIVQAIALAHEGSVQATERADGTGARVVLKLPGFTPAHR